MVPSTALPGGAPPGAAGAAGAGAAASDPSAIDPNDPDKAARLARLARKAESARLARLRHKQFVQEKQAEVTALADEEESLLTDEQTASASALSRAKEELQKAISPEQMQVRR